MVKDILRDDKVVKDALRHDDVLMDALRDNNVVKDVLRNNDVVKDAPKYRIWDSLLLTCLSPAIDWFGNTGPYCQTMIKLINIKQTDKY